jgi:tetratricopeptide (TPR) repeat protein
MEQTTEQLLTQAAELYKEEKYNDIIALLPDGLLEQNKNAVLYAWRAIALGALKDTDLSIADYTTAISLDDKYLNAYFNRGLAWYDKQEYDKAIDDYTKALSLNTYYTDAYYNRGLAWSSKLEQNKAIDDYTKAIAIDDKYANAYYNRGLAWYYKTEYNKAIDDFTKAIDLDDKYADSYNNRGNAWYSKNEFDKALDDYNKAISIDEKYVYAYNNRGLAWYNKNEYDKAVADYTTAILVSDEKYIDAYYNRATANYQKGALNDAITDYKTFIQLVNNPEDYSTKVAQAQIKELEKRITYPWYNLINELIDKLKKLLLFKSDCITHYTGISAARAMILSETGSPFRLSEGAFLNDTSEGRELNSFLDFSAVVEKDNSTIAKPFAEKPFIGSFVTDTMNDDLTLWRMYGKEDKTEAKGCSITINKNSFLSGLKLKVGSNNDGNTNLQVENQFTFYKVAYITRDAVIKFVIPGSPDNEGELNTLMNQLKDEVQKLDASQRLSIKELLNGIAYLFKSADYQYENEVRLVVQGVGFEKKIDITSPIPKVFIELIDITSVLSKITLGPKVERADEWAAAFNYKIKQQVKDAAVEIVISHLPFK